jgi:hypothetical protein
MKVKYTGIKVPDKVEELYSSLLGAIKADIRIEVDRIWSAASEKEQLAMVDRIYIDGNEAFNMAAKKGNLELLKKFWKIANKKQREYLLNVTTLAGAAGEGHLNVVIWLCRVGSAELLIEDYRFAFRLAVQGGHLDVMNWLFGLVTPELRYSMLVTRGNYVLTMAAGKGHLDVVNFLFGVATPEQRADMLRVNTIDNAFDQAIDNGHYDVAKRLLEVATPEQRAAIIHHSAIFPYSPIIMSARRGDLKMVKTLLAYISGTTFTSVWQEICGNSSIKPQTKIELNSLEFQFELSNYQQAMQARSKEPVIHEVQAALRDGNLLIPHLVEIVTSYIPHTTQDIIVEYKKAYGSLPGTECVSVQLVDIPHVHVPFIEVPYLRVTDTHSSISLPPPPQPSQVVIDANAALREAMGLSPTSSRQPIVPPMLPASSTISSASSSLSNTIVDDEIRPREKVKKTLVTITPSASISLNPSPNSLNNEQSASL